LIHLVIATIAFLTYFIDREDIVWSFAQGRLHAQLLERILFSLAAAFIGIAAFIRNWALAHPESSSFALRLIGSPRWVPSHYPLPGAGREFSLLSWTSFFCTAIGFRCSGDLGSNSCEF
jgi:hypothetical protein